MNYTKLRPLLTRVLVKKLAPPKNVSKAGIILPENKTFRYGKIEEVGLGYTNEEGKLIKPTLQVGQFVLLPEYGGAVVPKQDPNGDDYLFYQENDILGTVTGLEDWDKKL